MDTEQPLSGGVVPNCQVTATTINCPTVESIATIVVYKDGAQTCAYHRKYGPVRRKEKHGVMRFLAQLGIGDEKRQLPSDCPGPRECPHIAEFREDLRAQPGAFLSKSA